jgi:catechol 2,3-dioxygenase
VATSHPWTVLPVPPDAQLTHIGLYVDNLDAMVAFYTGLIGLVVTDRGRFGDRDLAFLSRRADEHHQLVLVTGRQAAPDVLLLSQLSFRVDGLDALKHFHRLAPELGASAMEGRDHGNSWSIYFEDPEANRVEMYTSTPWYVRQPWRVALDLSQPNDVIEATTWALIQDATWQPVAGWQADMAARLHTGAAR